MLKEAGCSRGHAARQLTYSCAQRNRFVVRIASFPSTDPRIDVPSSTTKPFWYHLKPLYSILQLLSPSPSSVSSPSIPNFKGKLKPAIHRQQPIHIHKVHRNLHRQQALHLQHLLFPQIQPSPHQSCPPGYQRRSPQGSSRPTITHPTSSPLKDPPSPANPQNPHIP